MDLVPADTRVFLFHSPGASRDTSAAMDDVNQWLSKDRSQTAYANGPSVRFGAVGWSVAAPSGPHGLHQQPKVAADGSGSGSGSVSAPDTNQGFGSVVGKRLP